LNVITINYINVFIVISLQYLPVSFFLELDGVKKEMEMEWRRKSTNEPSPIANQSNPGIQNRHLSASSRELPH